MKRNQFSLSKSSLGEVVSKNQSFSSPYRPESREKKSRKQSRLHKLRPGEQQKRASFAKNG